MKKYITSDHIASSLANLNQLVFEVTDACNLKCEYCAYGKFYNDYDSRENEKLSLKKAFQVIDYLIPYWSSHLNMSNKKSIFISFYGGEPLLNMPFIKAVISYLEENVKSPNLLLVYSMTTNAILLHKYIDYLVKYDFSVLVSLDGNKENTSYRVDKKGNNAFERIEKNVDLVREKYPEYFKNRINFNSVLHNRNSVEEIHNFFKEKYNKIPTIGQLNNVGVRKDKQAEFNQTYKNPAESLHQAEHYEKIEEEMFIASTSYKELALFLHSYSGFFYRDYTDLLFDKERHDNPKSIPTGTCLPFAKKFFVTVKGKILPCERIGHQFALGEVTESGVNLDIEAIVDKYNSYYAKLDKQCSACKNAKVCIQCIFNLEDIETEKPICHGFMNSEAFQRYVNTQMEFLQKHPEAYHKIMEEVIVS